ncbi:MAG: IS4 family transposase [Bacteroidota bacterium]|nr:IS4 family transposase [Bacteroidota bacterium]
MISRGLIRTDDIGFDFNFASEKKTHMFKNHKVNIQKVLSLIPDDLLSRLSHDTKVDYCAKVLYGSRIFNLLLYGILTTDRTSQRTLEDLFKSDLFKNMFCYEPGMKVSRSSISTRLSNINCDFFRLAYEHIYAEFSRCFSKEEQLKYKVVRVDSSMVAETCNKLKQGIAPGDKKSKDPNKVVKQAKYTMAFDGLTACDLKIFTEPSFTSEDRAIPEVVKQNANKEGSTLNIYTFDRGVSSSQTFSSFNDNQIHFVGRLKTNRKFQIVSQDIVTETSNDLGELTLISSQIVNLYNHEERHFDEGNQYRLIVAERKNKIDTTPPENKGKFKKKENVFYFISNNLELSPKEIADIYKQRWDIEVFFRFIKQELNASHFLSVSENGIKVMLYMTLIASMLLLMYKKLNDLGYKTAKRRFTMELWESLVVIIIKECGGDPSLMNQAYFRQFTIP